MGKGQGSEPLLPAWHCSESGQVAFYPLSFRHVSGDVHRELLFEGFSFAGEGFDPAVTARRISVLQAARRRCLAKPSGSSLLSLPSRSRGSSSDALPLAGTPSSLELHGKVRAGSLDSCCRIGPLLVVRH